MKFKKVLFLAAIAFVLNSVWELSHYPLYFDMSGISKYPHLLLAAFTDMAIIMGIFLAVSIKNRSLGWIWKPRMSDYISIVVMGLVVAIFIELRALDSGRWAYTDYMPSVFGIGLSPLLQLFTTAFLSFLIIRFLILKEGGNFNGTFRC